MSESAVFRWVIAAVVVVGIICMLAYRRNDPGVGERVPDPEDAAAVVRVDDTSG